MISRLTLLGLLAAAPVHAEEGWTMNEMRGPDARRLCLATAADGTFALTVTQQAVPLVSWYGPVTQQPYEGLLVLNIDGAVTLLNASFSINDVAAVLDPLQPLSARQVFERIAAGNRLAVEDEDGRVFAEVSLQGSARAMEALLRCAEAIGESNSLDY